jgi:predicted amidohydrolase
MKGRRSDGRQSHSIAVVQGCASVEYADPNLTTLRQLVSCAKQTRADGVVMPELFANGYAPDRAWKRKGVAILVARRVNTYLKDLDCALPSMQPKEPP